MRTFQACARVTWHVYIYCITRQRGCRTWIHACVFLAVQCVSFWYAWVESHVQAGMTSIKWCVNYVFRRLCVSSIMCFITYVFHQLCVASITCFNELSVCVCGTQWLLVELWKKKERERGPDKIGVWQTECLCMCVWELERERERESACVGTNVFFVSKVYPRCFVYHKCVYVCACVCVFLNECMMCLHFETHSLARTKYIYGASLTLMWHSATLSSTHQHSATLINTQQHSSTLINTHQHSSIIINTHQHSSTLINTHQHSATLSSTAKCSFGSLTYASMRT